MTVRSTTDTAAAICASGWTMDRRIKAAVDLLRADLKQESPIAKVASQVGLSRTWFTELFKKEKGQAPKRYLMKLKLDRAAQLLAMTTLPIKEVREEVGFHDKSGFAKRFKRAYGMSPSEYRDTKGKTADEEGMLNPSR